MSDLPLAHLRCPISGLSLVPADHRRPSSAGFVPVVRATETNGSWERALASTDGRFLYPVEHGIPLLAPWWAWTRDHAFTLEPAEEPYAEGWSERDHYDRVGTQTASTAASSAAMARLSRIRERAAAVTDTADLLAETRFDRDAELDAYRFVLPALRAGRRTVLQIGGQGTMALALAAATGASGVLVTPSLGEAQACRAVAQHAALRVDAVVGVAELLPIADNAVDAVLSSGSLHHVDLAHAGREIARVLQSGGRLGAFEPWRARGYSFGTRRLGKRDPHVACVPLDRARLAPLSEILPRIRVQRHGAYSRYGLLAADRLGLRPSLANISRITKAADRLAARLGTLDRDASSVAVLWAKPGGEA